MSTSEDFGLLAPGGEMEFPGLWKRLRAEASEGAASDPVLARLYALIVESPSLEEALIRRLSTRLGNEAFPSGPLSSVLLEAIRSDQGIVRSVKADAAAVIERDPAAGRLIEPFLFFKGFAGIQTHRLAHFFWNNGKRDFALYLQSRSSEVFHTDIHPAARFGRGIFLDHATGFVAGETALIEDNVSILHGVTLGGTGTGTGQRHPQIRTGVLIGAGAQILGDVEIGAFSKIAAGTLVTRSVPARSTAAGVPARIIPGAGSQNPAKTMDHILDENSYESFTYAI